LPVATGKTEMVKRSYWPVQWNAVQSMPYQANSKLVTIGHRRS